MDKPIDKLKVYSALLLTSSEGEGVIKEDETALTVEVTYIVKKADLDDMVELMYPRVRALRDEFKWYHPSPWAAHELPESKGD